MNGFQIVFRTEGLVEAILLDGTVRTLTFDPTGSPFTAEALADAAVQAALRQWMLDSNAEGWVEWRELTTVLQALGVDMERVAAENRA
nr:hypothetical protein [uncultured Roseococcus sp.]